MKFEWNDLRAGITIANVALIIQFGLAISWFGLALGIFGLCSDFHKYRVSPADFRINNVIIHFANSVLNVYFLFLLS